MKLIWEPLLFLPSSNMFWTLGSGLGDRFRRFAKMSMKTTATMAAQPPTEPTTTPATVPPARFEPPLSSFEVLGVGVEVGLEPPTVTVLTSPPALVSTATVSPVVVDAPEVVLVEPSDFVCRQVSMATITIAGGGEGIRLMPKPKPANTAEKPLICATCTQCCEHGAQTTGMYWFRGLAWLGTQEVQVRAFITRLY